jgi:uncharacterized protein (TIGR00299 family) protein
MKTLHFDCFAGISGDMTLGALVGLGASPEHLTSELHNLKVHGWSLRFAQEERCGITGTRALVEVDEAHGHHHGHHHHTHWSEIKTLIETSGVNEKAKRLALRIFEKVAIAEAKVHNKPVESVAFHEVGAVDSIIDIVGAAICLTELAPERITASAVELGGGFVQCAHGLLPVPAPATALILQGLPVKEGGFDCEMTTPTGAAILATVVDEFLPQGIFTEAANAYGVGGRKLDKPNLLKASWRESADKGTTYLSETLTQIECTIDDMTGEHFAHLMDQLYEAGALDVAFVPCTLQKSRPGTLVKVLCAAPVLCAVRRALFVHSTTIGFREALVNRLSLPRTEEMVEGVRHKTVYLDGQKLRSKPEYEDAKCQCKIHHESP